MGDIWVIDMDSRRVLHYGYFGIGPAAGLAALGSREFGSAYLSDGSVLESFGFSGETDGVLGIGGAGTLTTPFIPLNPQSTSFSGGPAVGFGAGMGALGTYTWFKKVYQFNEAPSHLPLGR